MKNPRYLNALMRDIAIIALSILVAVILARTDALVNILTSSKELELLGSFIAGMFFTSLFTTAPAMVTLGEIAQTNSLFLTALFGAIGAATVDLIIFIFVKDRFSKHVMEVVATSGKGKRFNG
jgi:hypothetical protein